MVRYLILLLLGLAVADPSPASAVTMTEIRSRARAAKRAAPARRAPKAAPEASPKNGGGKSGGGVYPVYDVGGRWLLLDRRGGRGSRLSVGAQIVVIGSGGAGLFSAAKSTTTMMAACRGSKAAPTPGFMLSARNGKEFQRVGTPILAIANRTGRPVDPSGARSIVLKNMLRESVYQALEPPIREAVLNDLRTGAYAIPDSDAQGRSILAAPSADGIQMKIDFATMLPTDDLADYMIAVEGAQVSQSYRRCLRMLSRDKIVGKCAEMPHALRQETRQLEFVAYDPDGGGPGFVMAYSKDEPLWGHERWGFQVNPRSGPKVFLQDALDPRCRESF